MGSCVAFLTRLRRIADEATPLEERRARAFALVDAYKAGLSARLGIANGGKLTQHAKALAGDALDELRLEVLKTEIEVSGAAAILFAATRYRIEMVRRALALRLAHDGDADVSEPVRPPLSHPNHPDRPPRYKTSDDDLRIIRALRRQLADRRAVVMSRHAILQSHALIACDDRDELG
jgi:hypothetical protein